MPHLINLSHADVDTDANLEGYDVIDSSGEKIGDIDSVIADGDSMQLRYLVVDSGGWFSSKKFVVPVGDVQRIDENDKRVYFKSVSRQNLQGGSYPRYDESWWDNNDHANFSQHEQQVAAAYPATTSRTTTATTGSTDAHTHTGQTEMKSVDYDRDLYRRPTEGAERLQLMEERLSVNKERYQAGEVRLGKRIIEQTQTVNVPITEERVVIERHAVTDGRAVQGGITGDNRTIEVDVMAERVNTEKEAFVSEEVSVRKEAVQHTERVSDTVRREELVVEGQEGLVQTDGGTTTGRERTTEGGNRNPLERAADAVQDKLPGDRR